MHASAFVPQWTFTDRRPWNFHSALTMIFWTNQETKSRMLILHEELDRCVQETPGQSMLTCNVRRRLFTASMMRFKWM
jgi:hypothetical protein